MDKRQNHIIFWVGYCIFFNCLFFFTTSTNGFKDFVPTFWVHNTNTIAHILLFYVLIKIVFPKTLPNKKYLSAIILTINILFLFGLLLLLVREYIFLENNFLQFRITVRVFFILINNFQNVIIASLIYWFVRESIVNEQRKVSIELESLALQRVKNQANLKSLKGQINPHFLYNTLNLFFAQAIPFSSRLSEAIITLSEIMRYSIDKNESRKVLLCDEIKYLEKYINLIILTSDKPLDITLKVNGNISFSMITPFLLFSFLDVVLIEFEQEVDAKPLLIIVGIYNNRLSIDICSEFSLFKQNYDWNTLLTKLNYFYPNDYGIEYSEKLGVKLQILL